MEVFGQEEPLPGRRPDGVKGRKVPMLVDNKEVVVSGRFPRTARLRAEYFECIDNPGGFVAKARAAGLRADIFTFLPALADRNPRHDLHFEQESISVLPITTYENWWNRQINGKTRNMIRKAQKSGVEVRVVEFTDEFVNGIVAIYNELPLRQGKPFKHYGKNFETLKQAHITFLERSEFIGAFYGNELIGFVKLVHDKGISSMMQIISKIAHRDKSPTNALIAKAVEICAGRKIPCLHYGVWSRRTLGEFKRHHAFEEFKVPRYFVPLNARGKLFLALGMHRKFSEYLPVRWQDFLANFRAKWVSFKYRASTT